jgi:GAF domain-containing protein
MDSLPSDLSTAQLHLLFWLTEAAIGQRSLPDVLAALLARACMVVQATSGAILLVDEASGQLVVGDTLGCDIADNSAARPFTPTGVVTEIIHAMFPSRFDDLHAMATSAYPLPAETRSLLGIPLCHAGTLLGVLLLGTATPNGYAMAEMRLLALASGRLTADIIQAQLVAREHH